jgi:hypothetical protein
MAYGIWLTRKGSGNVSPLGIDFYVQAIFRLLLILPDLPGILSTVELSTVPVHTSHAIHSANIRGFRNVRISFCGFDIINITTRGAFLEPPGTVVLEYRYYRVVSYKYWYRKLVLQYSEYDTSMHSTVLVYSYRPIDAYAPNLQRRPKRACIPIKEVKGYSSTMYLYQGMYHYSDSDVLRVLLFL